MFSLKSLLIITVVSITAMLGDAYASEVTFSKFNSSDSITSLIPLSSGGYLSSSMLSNAIIVRYDDHANILSATEYKTPGTDGNIFSRLVETNDGGFAAIGVGSFGNTGYPVIARFNAAGVPQWQYFFPGNAELSSID